MNELFYAAVCLFGATDSGHTLRSYPGLWSYATPDGYTVWLNGHEETLSTSTGHDVEFGHCYIEFNGWPFAVLAPNGGEIGAGELANEDACIESFWLESERLKPGYRAEWLGQVDRLQQAEAENRNGDWELEYSELSKRMRYID